MKRFLKTYKNRLTISFIILVIVNIIVMRSFDEALQNEICKGGIISFELAKELDESVKILDSWDEKAKINAGLSLGFDFLFLLIYSSLIALFIYNINNRLWKSKPFYQLGRILVILIYVAALFDVIENFALIKLLSGELKQVWSSVAFYFASMKFGIILICISYILINWSLLFIVRAQKPPLKN